MTEHEVTPGQTIGPFFHDAMRYAGDRQIARAVRLHGYVVDGDGQGVPDAMIEVRQADGVGVVPRAEGSRRRDGLTFTGWGRSLTDAHGHWWVDTLVPAPVPPATSAFFALVVFARGLTDRLFTRCYVPDSDDALLRRLSDEERATLVASWEDERVLRFDVRLQGEGETVFLTYPRHPR